LQITNCTLRIANQELQIKNGKSRMANQELQIKNCISRIANLELQSKSRIAMHLNQLKKIWTIKSFFSRLLMIERICFSLVFIAFGLKENTGTCRLIVLRICHYTKVAVVREAYFELPTSFF
jgi:hypothetical protein